MTPEQNLYNACKNVVDRCEDGFKALGMDGPNLSMGSVWYNAYRECKEAVEFADQEKSNSASIELIKEWLTTPHV